MHLVSDINLRRTRVIWIKLICDIYYKNCINLATFCCKYVYYHLAQPIDQAVIAYLIDVNNLCTVVFISTGFKYVKTYPQAHWMPN